MVGSVTYNYHYDEAGQVDSITKKDGSNQTTYFYIRNILGEIIGITNEAGELVVEYQYDAWGNLEGITGSQAGGIGQENPFRYKGYYYDTETSLYYCNSRYYNPQWGRWLNADGVEYLDPSSVNSVNLFMYCGNNPVMNVDPYGHAWYDVLAWIGVGLLVASAIVLTAGLAGVVIGGVAGGIIYGAAIGTLVLGTVGAAAGAAGGMIYDAEKGNDFGTSIWAGTKMGFGIGTIAGAIIGGSIGGAASYSVSGLTNTSFWTGLGKNGAQIAANASNQNGLITLGQTFGGKCAQFMTNRFGYAATKYL